MREFKFRQFWQNIRSAKTFHYWGFVRKGEFEEPIPPLDMALKNTQQFTGLRDKNGKEIYEGDIICKLVTYTPIDSFMIKLVTFDRGKFLLGETPLGWVPSLCLEVIGNIHENPELLEVKDENI